MSVLGIAGMLWAGVALDGARAQPFGRAYGHFVQVRDEGRHEGRREEGGRGGGRGEEGGRGGYRAQPPPQAYAPAPRGYAYPAPAYPYRQAPPNYAPPRQSYAVPRGYAPPPPVSRYAPAPGARGNVPLGQAMANIRRVMPGRILDAWTEPGPDGRPTYRVRWAATGGRRIDFIVDAATGAIIGQSGY